MAQKPRRLTLKQAIQLVLNASLMWEIQMNEKWLRAELLHHDVDPHDPELSDKVCDIILHEGHVVREAVEKERRK